MKLRILLTSAFIYLFFASALAQTICGLTGAPAFNPPSTSEVEFGASAPIPSLSTAGPLPTVEYAITVQGTAATDGWGDAILGFTTGSSFNPSDYGVLPGETVCLQPVGYDLPQVQGMIDQIFQGSFFGAPCCNIVGLVVDNLCPNLTAGGINSGSDIQGLSDVLDLLAIFSGNPNSTVSVNGFIREVDTLNIDAASLPGACGGNNIPICYAVASVFTSGRIVCYDVAPLLSIELSNFEVVTERTSNDLFWTTLNETNNDYFGIERSTDGIDFVEIDQVLGAGNSSSPINYIYIDRTPPNGYTYYRLASYDYEGNVEYSEVKVVKRVPNDFELLSFGPNPTQGDLNFTFSTPNTDEVSYQIQDIAGRVIQSGVLPSNVGINDYSLDVNHLNNGLFFITFFNNKSRENFKFIRN